MTRFNYVLMWDDRAVSRVACEVALSSKIRRQNQNLRVALVLERTRLGTPLSSSSVCLSEMSSFGNCNTPPGGFTSTARSLKRLIAARVPEPFAARCNRLFIEQADLGRQALPVLCWHRPPPCRRLTYFVLLSHAATKTRDLAVVPAFKQLLVTQ